MSTYYSTVPYEIIESERIDGAGTFKIISSIMVPILMPMIGLVFIIGFQSMWNELIISILLLQKAAIRIISLGIGMMQGQYGLDNIRLTAAVMTASFVPIVLFFFFQKYISMGAFAGSVKG